MSHCRDYRPPVATNRSQETRFHLVRFDAMQEDLSHEFHRKVVVNDFAVKRDQSGGVTRHNPQNVFI
jgi:hypothetical protein